MTVLRVERITAHPDHATELVSAVTQSCEQARRSDGCLWCEALSDDEHWVVLSEWRSESDERAWDTASGLQDAVDPFVTVDVTVRLFASTD